MSEDRPAYTPIINRSKGTPFSPESVPVMVGLPLAAQERQDALDNIRGALRRLREEIEGWDRYADFSRADVLAAIDRKIAELSEE